MRDPLPGELVRQAILEDSLRMANKDTIKADMIKVLDQQAHEKSRNKQSGYFLTDFNHDGLPELWIKTTNFRNQTVFELFFPLADGHLKKSELTTEGGSYYMGDEYILQAISPGEGYLNVNHISISNRNIVVDHIKEIDLYNSNGGRLPKFEEPEIRLIPFTDTAPLQQAFD